MQKQILGVAIVAALLAGCNPMATSKPAVKGPVPANAAYQADKEGNVQISQYGECIKSAAWSKETAIDVCEGIVEKAPEPAPVVVEPEPAPAPAPAPAPVVEQLSMTGKALFASASAKLTGEGRRALENLTSQLAGYDNIEKLVITGHTDSQGGEAYNQKLSEKRADAVRAYIVKSGVAGNAQIMASGMGEAAPVASNATAEGRQQNRRVEVEVTGSKTVN